ncbi:Endo-chitosanase [Pseudocercospora fuligena]|uniref:Endo-chitosanase n=1 Tax=Pseudocercospora fuligena TaxID=685502 RepID=A0A8H6RCC7_9PEZI|nr:Endo-chitosanase [Pseudocercospora fuligena]
MATLLNIALVSLSTLQAVRAYSIPANLQTFYNNYRTRTCSNILFDGFDDGTFEYCATATTTSSTGAIYLHSSANGGRWDNLDIDCDGASSGTGACADDPTGQGITAFQYLLPQYGINDLDAQIHPYVVFGNDGDCDDCSYIDPTEHGMQPLSVMAVVCNGQLHYGVWGDINGEQDTGETSLALGNLCFPNENLSGNNGHDPFDVLYIGFTGSRAVPGASANWRATSASAFESSIKSIGDSLVASLRV